VFGGVVGQRSQDFAELGRTEIIRDNLNPDFKTPVELVSSIAEQVMVCERII
jgi:hypothetical protein